MPQPVIAGSFSVLFLFEVAEEIRLAELRDIVGTGTPGREPSFRHTAPDYVQFAIPPVVEPLRVPVMPEQEGWTGRIAYYEYGVVSLRLELPFEGGWDDVAALSARWMDAPELERRAAEAVRRHLERVTSTLVKPYREYLTEDYFIIHLSSVTADDGHNATAEELIKRYADPISQIVRGERATFSAAERNEILESRMSYYETDLLVVGWSAALVYDTPAGAAPTIQLLEYANTQLLEFRHYDAVLTALLSRVYRSLEKGTGFLGRWRLAREAEHLSTIRLDVRELTERVDNSIKFLSDTFAARLYRMAAARIGVPDYRNLVEQKLQSAGDLYAFMMDRFYQGRAFVLELMVVVILIIELVYFFRGIR
jgi:hypothetical protein